MSKTHPFSIYLLKPGYDATNVLKADHTLEAADAHLLPEGATLFVLDTPPRSPWWRSYFDIEQDLYQQSKGALIVLQVDDRCFAISFGQVYHHMDDNSYEYDFGLKVTLNSLDPSELKSADMMSPGSAKRKRTQVAISTDLTFLDFDGNSEIIKSLTGKVKEEFRALFKNATGSASLKVSMKILPADLPGVCQSLLQLYQSEEYKTSFPNIQNIAPVKDPNDVLAMNSILIDKFRTAKNEIVLAIPDIVDYHDTKTCCFFRGPTGTSEIFPDITIEGFYEYLGQDFDYNHLTIETLRQYSLVLCDVDGKQGNSYGLFRSLIFDTPTQPDGAIYHLSDGNWYRAEEEFVHRITNYLNAKCVECSLPHYNHDQEKDGKYTYSEGNYNRELNNWNSRFICLDQTDISPSGNTSIEPCDAYTVMPEQGDQLSVFYHIKISTRSSHLSHLFNQGVNAVEIVRMEEEAREKLVALITEKIGDNDLEEFLRPLRDQKFMVVFGIITHKAPEARGENLPLFSRLSLMRGMRQLDLYRIPTALMFIDDQSPKKGGHSRHPKINVVVAQNAAGKKWVHAVPGQEGVNSTLEVKRCPSEIRESPVGTVFTLEVNLSEEGTISSYHSWDYEVIEG